MSERESLVWWDGPARVVQEPWRRALGLAGMSDDLMSVRILAAFGSAQDRALLRQAAAMAPIPVDIIEAERVAAAHGRLLADAIDVAFLDAAAAPGDLTAFIAAARATKPTPFVILVAAAAWGRREPKADGLAPDGIVAKPAMIEQAKVLINRCIKLRMPSHVLVVDDSATMRNIVRKLLTGIRFPLEIAEAEEGIAALKQIASGKFDFVFLDYNMPGLNGVETLSEIKRQYPKVQVVIMTSVQDETVAERARAAGAAAFLRKPFYPADIDAVLQGIYGLRASARTW
jgi:CheY-like chemotaxis protein